MGILHPAVAASAVALFSLVGWVWTPVEAGPNDAYRPYAHDNPQIIQADDYPPIQAVQALVQELKAFGDTDISWEAKGTSLSFKPSGDSRRPIVVGVPDKGPVSVAARRYPGDSTALLFKTLRKVLLGVSASTKCHRLRADKFRVPAYEIRAIVEFDCGPQIVVLDSLSNGPIDGERLYILDVVPRADSYFWAGSGTFTPTDAPTGGGRVPPRR